MAIIARRLTWRTNAACRVAMMRWVSATATPSAASAGAGADLSRSSCATMYPTCGFSAAPRPTIVFFTSAGEYSAIGDALLLGREQDNSARVAQDHRRAQRSCA